MYPQMWKHKALIPYTPTRTVGISHTRSALFINGKYFFIPPRLSAEAGLRYSGTAQFGKFNYHTYRQGEIIDTQTYGKGELIKFYGGFEPRIALYFLPGSNQRISLSYNLTRQYIGQVSSSSIGFPTDFWMPASRNIPPQRAHSFSAGYSIALDQDNYEFSSELYYKRLHNQMESGRSPHRHDQSTIYYRRQNLYRRGI